MILNGLLKCARHAYFSSIALDRAPCSSQTAAGGSSRRGKPHGPSWRDGLMSQGAPSTPMAASGPFGRGLAQSIEHRDVGAAVEIPVLERNPVGLMKQIGVEDHGPVGTMRNSDRARSRAPQEVTDVLACIRIVVLGKAPFQGRGFIPDDQAPAFGIEIGLIGRNPEIDVD